MSVVVTRIPVTLSESVRGKVHLSVVQGQGGQPAGEPDAACHVSVVFRSRVLPSRAVSFISTKVQELVEKEGGRVWQGAADEVRERAGACAAAHCRQLLSAHGSALAAADEIASIRATPPQQISIAPLKVGQGSTVGYSLTVLLKVKGATDEGTPVRVAWSLDRQVGTDDDPLVGRVASLSVVLPPSYPCVGLQQPPSTKLSLASSLSLDGQIVDAMLKEITVYLYDAEGERKRDKLQQRRGGAVDVPAGADEAGARSGASSTQAASLSITSLRDDLHFLHTLSHLKKMAVTKKGRSDLSFAVKKERERELAGARYEREREKGAGSKDASDAVVPVAGVAEDAAEGEEEVAGEEEEDGDERKSDDDEEDDDELGERPHLFPTLAPLVHLVTTKMLVPLLSQPCAECSLSLRVAPPLERLACGCLIHGECVAKCLAEPPFSGRRCGHCQQRFVSYCYGNEYREKMEKRWEARQRAKREVDDVADLFAS